MKHLLFPLSLTAMLLLSPTMERAAHAVDHDNADAGRPLDFDDAETIAYREFSRETGVKVKVPGRGATGVDGDIEYLYGFARNWQLNIGLDASYQTRANARPHREGSLGLGLQHNFNRETQTKPALGVRLEASIPGWGEARGVDTLVRCIASRKCGRFGRLHLNGDLTLNNSPHTGERRMVPGLILGYTAPLGLPVRFDRTLLAQLSYRQSPEKGEHSLLGVGLGLRQQVTPQSVIDVGLQSEFTGAASTRQKLQLTAGYSTAF